MTRLGLWGVLFCLAGQPAFAQVPALPRGGDPTPRGLPPSPELRGLTPPARQAPPLATPAQPEPTAHPEGLFSFDPRTANLTWQELRWRLTAGETVLKDFGRQQHDARQALRLIRELGLSERGTVGGQRPGIEYWLAQGQPPRKVPPGVRPVVFDRASLRVEQTQLRWCVRDAQQVLFDFGHEVEDARQTLAVLQQHGFNQVATVGQGRPTMMVFFAGPEMPGTATHPGTMARGPRFPRNRRAPKGAESEAFRASFGARHPATDLDQVVTPAVPLLADPADESFGSSGALAGRRPAGPYPTLGPDDRFGKGTGSLPTFSRASASAGVPQIGDALGVGQFPRRTTFDWQQVDARPEGGSWKLMAGEQELARFGTDEKAARRALAVIRHYRFTEQVEPAPLTSLQSLAKDERALRPPLRAAPPRPGFSYFLVQGKPPAGLMPGMQGQAFDPHRVTLRQAGHQWAVCTREGTLMLCGSDFDRARRVRDAIRYHRFDHLYHVGTDQPGEGMTFLVKERK